MKITKKQLIKTIREELAIMQEEDPGDELAQPDPAAGDSITAFADLMTQAGVNFVWLQSGDDFYLPDNKVGVTVQDSREPVAPPMKKKDILP